jgi:beta-galactosidase
MKRRQWRVAAALLSFTSLCAAQDAPQLYFGADLSFVNELEDCGASWRAGGKPRDVFELLHERGANLVRVRLWNDARWTRYSNLADVRKTIRRAKGAGMQVLLDFHYSDDWADGDKQIIPKAWAGITDVDRLAGALYDFTYRTLRELDAAGLMPEMVQVGNETNGAILSTLEKAKEPIEWTRNAKLFNAGIKAVRDAGARSTVRPRVMLHIAQPENVEPWFAAAAAAGVTDFDLIGVSYYRKWSSQDLAGLGEAINRLRHRYAADVLLVEAAYPWTLAGADSSGNILGEDSLIARYPATIAGQRRYLLDLSQLVLANGGVGVVYWEPAWISSRCKTRWGTGSGWENAALFDFKGEILPGADYLRFPYVHPVTVEFRGATQESFLWGDFLGAGMTPVRVQGESFRTRLMPGTRLRFQLYATADRSQPLLRAEIGDRDGMAHALVGTGATVIDLQALRERQGIAPPGAAVRGNFNGDWEFRKLPAQEWEKVTLPHTAHVEPRIVNDQWQGKAEYRKRFRAEDAWRGKHVWLRFEAAMNVAEVRLNGRLLMRHLGGYLPFVVDLGERLRFGTDNEVTVSLDNRDNEITGPKPMKTLDFNMYGGLYRDATLVIKEPVHITDEIMAGRKAGGGVFVTYPHVSRERADILIKTDVSQKPSRITHTLWIGRQRVAEGVSTDGRDVTLSVANPRLWSPRAPNLYQLVTRLEANGKVTDERVTRIGIRSIGFAGNRILINGEPQFLRGVNRHQEYPYVGYAISPGADYRDAKAIKEAGFDFVRLSHYPHSPDFMAAADELGLAVLNSILGWQFYNDDPAFRRQILQTCRDLVRRDRNHPSVIAWECSLNESAMPAAFVKQLHQIVHEEYPGDQAFSAGWQNDGYDIYIQARQHRIEHYTPPDRPYLVSEYGDWEYYALNAGLNQEHWKDLLPEARTSRQLLGDGEARLLQQATNLQEAHNDNFTVPAFADAYWVMFDYNRGYADDLEASGVMSLERLPKFSYHFFRSQRDADSGPVVQIASYWTPESPTRVRVFANTDEVELLLNGRSLGRRPPPRERISNHLPHPPFWFDVPAFEAGTLEAVGFIGGKAVAMHRVMTPGQPVKLEVEIDDAGICASARDLLFARARLVDANGTTVPSSGAKVEFATSGAGITLVGEQVQTSEAGVASALVRVAEELPEGEVTATWGGLVARARMGHSAACLLPSRGDFYISYK